jgi:serine/threonine-protein kinase
VSQETHHDKRRRRLEEQLAGRYALGQCLGHGGMGEVWRAFEPELARHVAIKILSGELSRDAEFVARFQREAVTLAKFKYRRIVQILAIGRLAREDRLFMVMELLPGRTLRQVIDSQKVLGAPLDWVTAAYHTSQMLDALRVAHSEGIIHRDVKPENMIVRDDGFLTLLDFGLAKAGEVSGPHKGGTVWQPPLALTAGTTRKSTLLGTPRYMSPELIKRHPIDTRSDLYPVGVLLVLMLTLEYCYDLGRDPDPPIPLILQAHLDQAPRLRRDNNPDCPDELWDLALRLLAKDPDDRFASAEAAYDALEPFIRASAPPTHPIAKLMEEEREEQRRAKVFAARASRNSLQEAPGAQGSAKDETDGETEAQRRPPAPTRPRRRRLLARGTRRARVIPRAEAEPAAPEAESTPEPSSAAGPGAQDKTVRMPEEGFVPESPCADIAALQALPAGDGNPSSLDAAEPASPPTGPQDKTVPLPEARQARLPEAPAPEPAVDVRMTAPAPVQRAAEGIPAWVPPPHAVDVRMTAPAPLARPAAGIPAWVPPPHAVAPEPPPPPPVVAQAPARRSRFAAIVTATVLAWVLIALVLTARLPPWSTSAASTPLPTATSSGAPVATAAAAPATAAARASATPSAATTASAATSSAAVQPKPAKRPTPAAGKKPDMRKSDILGPARWMQ